MKKTKLIFCIIISLILLIGIFNRSKAITLSTSQTPSSVESESEFSIIIKFDQKVMGFNAYITYDSSLVTMSASSTNPNLTINPTAGDNKLGLAYIVMNPSAAEDTFEIKVKTSSVTEEKVAQFEITEISITRENDTIGEMLDDTNVNVTIKPTVQQPKPTPEPEPTPKPAPTNNNNTLYNKGSLAKTGESQFILVIIAGLIITTIVIKIKSKKVM